MNDDEQRRSDLTILHGMAISNAAQLEPREFRQRMAEYHSQKEMCEEKYGSAATWAAMICGVIDGQRIGIPPTESSDQSPSA